MQTTCIELLTSCATAHYVNGTVETDTREQMSLESFCRGMGNIILEGINLIDKGLKILILSCKVSKYPFGLQLPSCAIDLHSVGTRSRL